MNIPRHYRTEEVAALLHIGRSRVYQLADQNAFGHVERVGWTRLYLKSAVHAYIKKARIPAKGAGRPKAVISSE